MNKETEQLKKVLKNTTIMFAVTMVGHLIVYLCNNAEEKE